MSDKEHHSGLIKQVEELNKKVAKAVKRFGRLKTVEGAKGESKTGRTVRKATK